jgi:hypothetical protein
MTRPLLDHDQIRLCAWCSRPLGNVRDFIKGPGLMHPDCAKAYRRRYPTPERETTLPKHLR